MLIGELAIQEGGPMDPVTLFLIPAFAGGVGFALLLIRLSPEPHANLRPDPLAHEPLTTDVINMARIRVAGVGGLGLVAMAVAVAWFVPRIGETVAVGLVLGAVFGGMLILRRQRTGPMRSSSMRPGANTTLSIDVPTPDDRPEAGRAR
jgi:hypothetical protein